MITIKGINERTIVHYSKGASIAISWNIDRKEIAKNCTCDVGTVSINGEIIFEYGGYDEKFERIFESGVREKTLYVYHSLCRLIKDENDGVYDKNEIFRFEYPDHIYREIDNHLESI